MNQILVFSVFFLTACQQVRPVSAQRTVQTKSPNASVQEVQIPVFAGKHVYVDLTTQELYYRDGSTVLLKTPCGSGNGAKGEENETPTGDFKLTKVSKNHVSTIYDVPMPYAMRVRGDVCLHGSYGFVTSQGKGMPQSHGCIRIPVEVARKLWDLIPDGTPIHIRGDFMQSTISLGHREFFDVDVKTGAVRLKILRTSPDLKDVQAIRQAFLEKRLFIKKPSDDCTDPYQCTIGFPTLPESTHIPLRLFESIILTPQEKVSGVRITLD